MTTADIDWDYLLDTRVLHLTGITAALSENCYSLCLIEAIRAHMPPGVMVSFDVNYRPPNYGLPNRGEKLRPLITKPISCFAKVRMRRAVWL